jgi:hypothetical protein
MDSNRVRDGLGRRVSKNEDQSKRNKKPYTAPSPKIRADCRQRRRNAEPKEHYEEQCT